MIHQRVGLKGVLAKETNGCDILKNWILPFIGQLMHSCVKC